MVRLYQLSAALLLLPLCSWSFSPSSSRSHSRSRSPFLSSPFTTHLEAATTISIDPSDVLAVPEPPVSLASIDNPKVGVLLLNLGGPETGDDVEGTFESTTQKAGRLEAPVDLSQSFWDQ